MVEWLALCAWAERLCVLYKYAVFFVWYTAAFLPLWLNVKQKDGEFSHRSLHIICMKCNRYDTSKKVDQLRWNYTAAGHSFFNVFFCLKILLDYCVVVVGKYCTVWNSFQNVKPLCILNIFPTNPGVHSWSHWASVLRVWRKKV